MILLAYKRIGRQTVKLENPPSVAAGACVVGQKEGQGPLRKWFDYISEDSYFGQESWEKAESVMLSILASTGRFITLRRRIFSGFSWFVTEK